MQEAWTRVQEIGPLEASAHTDHSSKALFVQPLVARKGRHANRDTREVKLVNILFMRIAFRDYDLKSKLANKAHEDATYDL